MMLIGELAKSARVSAATVRYYERLGLLRPARRSRSGYRQYDSGALAGLTYIKAAQRLGFTLAEIRELLVATGGSLPGSDQLRAAGESKLDDLRRRIAELQLQRDDLRRLVDDCHCPNDRCLFVFTDLPATGSKAHIRRGR